MIIMKRTRLKKRKYKMYRWDDGKLRRKKPPVPEMSSWEKDYL